ncbi:REP element-mobilizing transposase RayT [Bradyrhizobium sp. USDA 4353]
MSSLIRIGSLTIISTLACSMPNYRRTFVPGGCWFFTINILDRRLRLLIEHIDLLRSAVAATRERYPFEIDAFVVMPDHLHAVWTLPPDDADSQRAGG